VKGDARDPVPGIVLAALFVVGLFAWWVYAATHCHPIGVTASGEPVLECK